MGRRTREGGREGKEGRTEVLTSRWIFQESQGALWNPTQPRHTDAMRSMCCQIFIPDGGKTPGKEPNVAVKLKWQISHEREERGRVRWSQMEVQQDHSHQDIAATCLKFIA